MVDKVKTIVRIAGREYTIRGEVPEEYIHKVAILVNRKMEEVTDRQPGLSTAMAAVLTAINLGDEVLKLQGELESFKERIEKLEEIIDEQKEKAAMHAARPNPTPPAIYDVSRKGKR